MTPCHLHRYVIRFTLTLSLGLGLGHPLCWRSLTARGRLFITSDKINAHIATNLFCSKNASALQGGDIICGKGVGGEVALVKLVKHPRRPSGCQGKYTLALCLWRNRSLARPTLATVGWSVQKQELSSRPALDSSILRAVPKTKLVSR